MPSEQSRIAQRLLDIIGNVDAALGFVSSMTQEQFVADLRTYYATLRALEIISEASRHLPDDLKNRNPAIRWQDIRSAGNFYRHEYLKVSVETVWETVVVGLQPLRTMAEMELNHLGFGHLVKKG